MIDRTILAEIVKKIQSDCKAAYEKPHISPEPTSFSRVYSKDIDDVENNEMSAAIEKRVRVFREWVVEGMAAQVRCAAFHKRIVETVCRR